MDITSNTIAWYWRRRITRHLVLEVRATNQRPEHLSWGGYLHSKRIKVIVIDQPLPGISDWPLFPTLLIREVPPNKLVSVPAAPAFHIALKKLRPHETIERASVQLTSAIKEAAGAIICLGELEIEMRFCE